MENPLSNEPEMTAPVSSEPKTDEQQSTHSAIRTLHSDVAASVRDNGVSITKIALAQQAKNEGLSFITQEKVHFWSAWSIGTVGLVLAGFFILIGAIVVVMSKNVSLPFTNQESLVPTLVPVVEQTAIDTTRVPRAGLIRSINTFIDGDYSSPVALEALILQEMTSATTSDEESITSLTPLPIERLLKRLDSQAPGRLVRSIGPDMTLGRSGGTPFIVIRVSSYETAFAGMLEWEPFMARDLSFITKKIEEPPPEPPPSVQPILPIDSVSTSSASSSTAATSSAPTTATTSITPINLPPPLPLPPVLTWKDIIVKNKDVRALVTRDGDIVLLYAFPKDSIMVITQNKEAFALVVDALNAPVFGI